MASCLAVMTWTSLGSGEYIIDNNVDESVMSHELYIFLVMVIVPEEPEKLDGVICCGYDDPSCMLDGQLGSIH